MIPSCYKHADVRCVIPSDGQRIGFALNMDEGSIARFSIPTGQARQLAEALLDYLGQLQRQSPISSGSENCDGSPQDGQ